MNRNIPPSIINDGCNKAQPANCPLISSYGLERVITSPLLGRKQVNFINIVLIQNPYTNFMEQDSEPPFRSILTAKIRIPTTKPDIYARPRLTKKINQGLQSRGVLLILAPRGFGKTTLAAYWSKNNDSRIAWFSIDDGDNDLTVFWDYFNESLRAAIPEFRNHPLDWISSFHEHQAYLVELINRISVLESPVIVVLDDLQFINSQKVWEGISFFIDHLPENLNLVLLSN